jgi:hypothetical protein
VHPNDTRREAARQADGTFGFQPHTEADIHLPKVRRAGGRKSGAVVLGISALLASAVLTGCTPDGDVIDADYAQVCKDKNSQQRVEDAKCSDQGRSSGHYGWYFLPMGSSGSTTSRSLPGVGSALSGGTESIPSGTTAKSGVSSRGFSAVSRGGFGGSVGGFGGEGGHGVGTGG